MANYLINDEQLTSVANAIRAKTGSSSGLSFPNGFVSEIGELGTADHTAEDALLERNVSGTYSNKRVTRVATYAFQDCTGLTKVELGNCSSIGANAFNGCTGLTKVELGNCSSIGTFAFSGCTGLQEIWIDNNSVPDLGSSAIPNTFQSGTGAIYVPANMVSTYRASSSWENYKWHIVSQEDYPVTNFDSIQDSLSDFCTKLANGTATYDVGDFKTIDLGAEGKIRFQVAAKNADALASGSGNAAYTWVAMDLLKTTHRMNPSLSGTTEGTGAIGGWGKSEMRTYLNETIWTLLPSELRAVIKEVTKYSCIYDTSNTKVSDDTTTDKLWIPSVHEVFNNTTYETQGLAYTGIFLNKTNRKRSMPGASSAAYWWERSASSTSEFKCVDNSGNESNNGAHNSRGVLLGFCT